MNDQALAQQIASRLRAEGARDVEVTDNRVTFKGVKPADRPDLSSVSPIRMVRAATLVVHQSDGLEITEFIRHNWRSPALIGLGVALLVPMFFIHPNGPSAAAALAVILAAFGAHFGIARYRLSSWLRTLARQELSFLERRQLESHHEPAPER